MNKFFLNLIVTVLFVTTSILSCQEDEKILELGGVLSINPRENVLTGMELTAIYSGNENITFQWNKDGSAISNANSNKYRPTEAGNYSVTISAAGYNSLTSEVVNVSLAPNNLPGTITIQPNGEVELGVELTASYSGTEPVKYQWNKGEDLINGATSNKYTPTEPGSYSVTVSATGYVSKTSDHVIIVEVKKYTVAFDTNGGSEAPATQEVEKNNKAVNPGITPTKGLTTPGLFKGVYGDDGVLLPLEYTFDGWYLGDNEFDFDTPINENIILVAKWKITGTLITDVADNDFNGAMKYILDHDRKSEEVVPPRTAWYLLLSQNVESAEHVKTSGDRSKDVFIIGLGNNRAIKCASQNGRIFNINTMRLTIDNVTLTGGDITSDQGLVELGYDAMLTMRNGAMITGHKSSKAGNDRAAVRATEANVTIIMESGSKITNNRMGMGTATPDASTAGGLTLGKSSILIMRDGEITGNFIGDDNAPSDLYARPGGRVVLSNGSKLGKVKLTNEGDSNAHSYLTFAGAFNGSIEELNLQRNSSDLQTIIETWENVAVVRKELDTKWNPDSYHFTSADISKIKLGFFMQQSSWNIKESINDAHQLNNAGILMKK